ncbi:MAG TPA: guanylate kinase [bacterium]|nr:guanylate kinase [bacterium]
MNEFLPEQQKRLFVVSGPSGAGKSTILNAVFSHPDIAGTLAYSVSATTRRPRPGETEGESYYFLTDEKFDELVSGGGFLEWAKVHNARYGTPVSNVEKSFGAGKDLLLEIDVRGAKNVIESFPEAVLIFITAPPGEFRKRLAARPSNLSPDQLEKEIEIRMDTAKSELRQVGFYDYCIINKDLDEAVKSAISIILAERCRILPVRK